MVLIEAPEGIPIQVVVGYLRRCRNGMVELNAALERADFDFCRTYGHRMKGTGGAFGFAGMTEVGSRMEDAAQAHDSSALRKHAEALAEYLASVEVAGE